MVKGGFVNDNSARIPNTCRGLSTDRVSYNSTSVTVYGRGTIGFGEGSSFQSAFNTVLPPNNCSCIADTWNINDSGQMTKVSTHFLGRGS
jgi:hypothetical protein